MRRVIEPSQHLHRHGLAIRDPHDRLIPRFDHRAGHDFEQFDRRKRRFIPLGGEMPDGQRGGDRLAIGGRNDPRPELRRRRPPSTSSVTSGLAVSEVSSVNVPSSPSASF